VYIILNDGLALVANMMNLIDELMIIAVKNVGWYAVYDGSYPGEFNDFFYISSGLIGVLHCFLQYCSNVCAVLYTNVRVHEAFSYFKKSLVEQCRTYQRSIKQECNVCNCMA
jgi:hypothetical protein